MRRRRKERLNRAGKLTLAALVGRYRIEHGQSANVPIDWVFGELARTLADWERVFFLPEPEYEAWNEARLNSELGPAN